MIVVRIAIESLAKKDVVLHPFAYTQWMVLLKTKVTWARFSQASCHKYFFISAQHLSPTHFSCTPRLSRRMLFIV